MSKKFDYDYIRDEIEKRLSSGLIPESDLKSVSMWLKGMNSDIIQMKEANAKILSNYLNRGISKNSEDATNYKEVCTIIFDFLETHKDLNVDIASKLKSFIAILNDDSVSNKEKYEITEQFYDIKLKLAFQEKGTELLNFINKRAGDNIDYKKEVELLISTILNDANTPEERKLAQIKIEELLKYERELASILNHKK